MINHWDGNAVRFFFKIVYSLYIDFNHTMWYNAIVGGEKSDTNI